MPDAPILVQAADTPLNSLSPKTTSASFDVYTGDVVIAYTTGWNDAEVYEISNSGAALTWTLEEDVAFATYNPLRIWSAVLPEVREDLSVTWTRTSTPSSSPFRGDVLTFRGSDGVGVSAQNHQSNGAPSLNITTSGDNSAVVVVNIDDNGNDGSSRVWRTGAGSAVELYYDLDVITNYAAYHPNAGVAGTYAVGLSAPSGQWHSIAAVEVLSGTLVDVYAGDIVFTRKR